MPWFRREMPARGAGVAEIRMTLKGQARLDSERRSKEPSPTDELRSHPWSGLEALRETEIWANRLHSANPHVLQIYT